MYGKVFGTSKRYQVAKQIHSLWLSICVNIKKIELKYKERCLSHRDRTRKDYMYKGEYGMVYLKLGGGVSL